MNCNETNRMFNKNRYAFSPVSVMQMMFKVGIVKNHFLPLFVFVWTNLTLLYGRLCCVFLFTLNKNITVFRTLYKKKTCGTLWYYSFFRHFNKIKLIFSLHIKKVIEKPSSSVENWVGKKSLILKNIILSRSWKKNETSPSPPPGHSKTAIEK